MKKSIVAFFSASGVTAALSSKLAKAAGADPAEIKPAEPYTDADLNWQNDKSRSSVEMKDRSSRPAICSGIDNIADYDVIFVGFPIWWYREPSIIDTFMEMYDFTGKTIVPFATSGGSGLGSSQANMQALAKNAKVVSGQRFSSSVSESELSEWAKKYL